MIAEIQEFITYLYDQVKTHAIYVLGGQGEYIVNILPDLTSKESVNRVDEILTLISQNLKKYQEEGTFNMLTSRAFDCSGLGVYYFLLHGYIQSDTTADGLYKMCEKIESKDLTEGDMVFQQGTRSDGSKYMHHVGYYTGNSHVVESKGRKYGVVETDFKTGGWSHCGRPPFWKPGTISRILKYVKGNIMKGDDVRLVQSKLALLGYPCGTIDGQFGPNTDSAVRLFQRDEKLTVDGAVGKQTTEALGLIWAG